MMKRCIDIILSVLLIGLSLPLLLVGWLGLKCRRAEPVLVRGHGTPENPAGLLLFNSSGSDLFSAFLRRTSTDHLPVLFDVVAGKARLKDTVQWPR
jgi:lipopolysaccharide/colanic/teichoic acid biosynthesis glycosyltransferase